jgi:cytochrome c-type biogenesis protein CcmE
MKKSNALIIFLLVLAVVIVIAGIAYLWHATDIASIKEKTDKYAGEEVTIKGTVTARVSILGYGGFKMRDETDEIFVKYDGDLPAVGSDVKVTGIVRTDGFVWIAGKSWHKT